MYTDKPVQGGISWMCERPWWRCLVLSDAAGGGGGGARGRVEFQRGMMEW